MPQEALSDTELKALETSLNRYEPARVREALDDVHETSPRGADTNATASGPLDFGSVPAGVLIYRGEDGVPRLRVTVTEITGAFYDEFELTDARLKALVEAAVNRLEAIGASM
jgi:hypothetical protein